MNPQQILNDPQFEINDSNDRNENSIPNLSQENFIANNQTSDEVLQSAPQYYELHEDGSIPVISKSGLRICHLNVNSIPNKIDEIKYIYA